MDGAGRLQVEAAEAGTETEMSTVAMAWEAFLRAIEEARELHAAGAGSMAIADLLQHARELLDIIDDEISLNDLEIPGDVRDGLAQMRTHLATVERSLVTTH